MYYVLSMGNHLHNSIISLCLYCAFTVHLFYAFVYSALALCFRLPCICFMLSFTLHLLYAFGWYYYFLFMHMELNLESIFVCPMTLNSFFKLLSSYLFLVTP